MQIDISVIIIKNQVDSFGYCVREALWSGVGWERTCPRPGPPPTEGTRDFAWRLTALSCPSSPACDCCCGDVLGRTANGALKRPVLGDHGNHMSIYFPSLPCGGAWSLAEPVTARDIHGLSRLPVPRPPGRRGPSSPSSSSFAHPRMFRYSNTRVKVFIRSRIGVPGFRERYRQAVSIGGRRSQ